MPRSGTGRSDTIHGFDLSGVAVTAAVAPDGRLEPVGGTLPKLAAAARNRASRRVHTVIVVVEQDLTGTDLVRDSRGGSAWRALDDDFVVLPASTLADAVVQLQANKGRWPRIDCPMPAREPGFVGRDTLFEFIRRVHRTTGARLPGAGWRDGHRQEYSACRAPAPRARTWARADLPHRLRPRHLPRSGHYCRPPR